MQKSLDENLNYFPLSTCQAQFSIHFLCRYLRKSESLNILPICLVEKGEL